MDVKRAYRFRFYPTEAQAQVLAQTFGCVRFAYNHFLRVRTDAWMERQESINYNTTSSMLTALKKTSEHAWLNDVSSIPVQQSLRHLQSAFSNFFAKRSQYPSFKKKNGTQAAEYTASGFRLDGQRLRIAKLEGELKIRWSRTLPKAARVTTITISKDAADRYFVSLLCDDVVHALPTCEGKIGIDLGLTRFAIASTGEKVAGPKAFAKYEAKLAKAQRSLAKKQKGSANRKKARLRVARIHARIADVRKDFLHQLSTRWVRENQVIAIETLGVVNMQKNRCLAKSIGDQGWSEFVRQLEYKGRWYGREIVGIDRWYPSSKRCSGCGHTLSKLPLSVRRWTCPSCGVEHDRDVNAARNVLAAGLAVHAHGESASPLSR